MSYRYTNTEKWKDAWFVSLKPYEEILFNYLCDNCDIAGFIEIIPKNWANDIGCQQNIIEGALKGLSRGLIYSDTNDCIYIRTFLKHQKNLPLTPEKNPSHKGIMKKFEYYKYKFNIENIDNFIEGALKGFNRGTGNGNGNDKKDITLIKDITKEFYDIEILNSENDSGYIAFINWLYGKNELNRKFEKVLKKDDQISFKTFKELTDNYGKDKVKEKIMALENNTKKSYPSFNLTLRAWLKR
jgi:hypothetical protein